MEKKGIRNLPSNRGGPSESKKNQDVWPRGGRRREPSGSGGLGGGGNKCAPSLKQLQLQQRIDKRPKPRSCYYGGVGRNETTQLDFGPEVELDSFFLPGSKKQSLNHLLNFVYAPRDGGYAHERGSASKGSRSIATKKHKYNKEHFLQANCQFIVRDSGDYKQYLNNPDALVDWKLIEQVNVQVSDFPACPICLYPPVASKMTKCGHIYCWSCILHYLALSDANWRKCPICYESVHKQDLKSVIAIPHQTFNITETITFKLMKRLKGSLIAYPADAEVKEENAIFNISETGVEEIYSKLLTATTDDIGRIIQREKTELDFQLNADENAPEKCFIEEAIALLQQRENLLVEVLSKPLEVVEEKQLCRDMENVDLEQETANLTSKFYYFYQASDGQHIYLHAINARMLEHTYGSLEFGPKTLSGKILEKEGGSMTEELRKRLRYLQHLPVTCQFEVAEIHLKQPVINRETLEHFNDQIEVRRKRRQRRAKDEKKREKKIAEEENRQMGKFPVANIHLDSPQQFPDFGFEARLRSESESLLSEENSEASSNVGSLTNDIAFSGPSFATMLSTEKKCNPSAWHGLKSKTMDIPKLINATGTLMKSSTAVAIARSDSDVDLEGFEPVQSLNRSFGDAIAQALMKAEVDEGPSTGKKKKKKNKQKVLFTTNVAISGN